MHTRFGKLTGHRSGDGACELMDRDKYILTVPGEAHSPCAYLSDLFCKYQIYTSSYLPQQYGYFLNAK